MPTTVEKIAEIEAEVSTYLQCGCMQYGFMQ